MAHFMPAHLILDVKPDHCGGQREQSPTPPRAGTSLFLQKPRLALHEHNAQVTQGYTERQPAEEKEAAWLRGSSTQNSPHPKSQRPYLCLRLAMREEELGGSRQGLEQPRMQAKGMLWGRRRHRGLPLGPVRPLDPHWVLTVT